MSRNLLIAALSSGSGKTTLTMGLLRALRNRGLRVQPFKCGPDYIDTKWHELASGQESVNLDPWMMGHSMDGLLQRYGDGADLCLTEGAMGLFDGYDTWHGSAADVARTNGSAIVLVVNAQSAAYSVAASIVGARELLRLKLNYADSLLGVVFNRVGSANHYEYLRDACHDIGIDCLGYLPKQQDIELPSRHLGLTIDERYRVDSLMKRLAALVEQYVDIDQIISKSLPLSSPRKEDAPSGVSLVHHADLRSFPFGTDWEKAASGTVAVARDEAFNFAYRANIDSLRQQAKQLVFFSPIADRSIPDGTTLLYLPGGYPEFFVEALAANDDMLRSVRQFAERGGHIYAECGGMLYLSEAIVGLDGRRYPMAAVLPLEASFANMRLHLGYRQVEGGLRGHEFHYSDIRETGPVATLGQLTDAKGRRVATRIYTHRNVLATYAHLYWAN